jgi:L-lactate utilization protein LutB
VHEIETDLGERITSWPANAPVTLAPAIHKNKEEIIRLCSERWPRCARPPTPIAHSAGAVRAARDLPESGDGRHGATSPSRGRGPRIVRTRATRASPHSSAIHAAVVGREKLIPRLPTWPCSWSCSHVAASGQMMTVMCRCSRAGRRHVARRVRHGREFHLIISTNGRSAASMIPVARNPALHPLRGLFNAYVHHTPWWAGSVVVTVSRRHRLRVDLT